MSQKSLKINAILNTLKTVLALFFPLITFPFSSRILGPDNIGKVNFAQSVVSYFAILASLGISTYATREAAKVRDSKNDLNKVVTEIFVINMAATLISYLLLSISLVFVKKFEDYKALILICSSLIVFTTLGMGWLYQAVEDYFYITVRSLVFQIVSVVLLFALVKSKEDYLWYAGVNIISNVGANILNFIHAQRYFHFDFSCGLELKKHLRPIFILFASAIACSIFASIDTTMIGFMSNDVEVGLYSAGVKIIYMINGIFPALIIVVFPRISYYFSNNDIEKIQNLSEKTINCLLCFSIPISIGLYLLSEPFVLLFCGQRFYSAITISKILCPYLIFSAIGQFLGNTLLVAYGKEKIQLYAMSVACVCDIVLNVVFIRKYGANGAAFATLITQILLTILYIIPIFDFLKKLHFKKSALQFLFSSLVMGMAVYFVRNRFENMFFQLFVPFAVGVLVYALMLFVFRNIFFMETVRIVYGRIFRN